MPPLISLLIFLSLIILAIFSVIVSSYCKKEKMEVFLRVSHGLKLTGVFLLVLFYDHNLLEPQLMTFLCYIEYWNRGIFLGFWEYRHMCIVVFSTILTPIITYYLLKKSKSSEVRLGLYLTTIHSIQLYSFYYSFVIFMVPQN